MYQDVLRIMKRKIFYFCLFHSILSSVMPFSLSTDYDCLATHSKFSSCFVDLSTAILAFFFAISYLIYHIFQRAGKVRDKTKVSLNKAVLAKMNLLVSGNLVLLMALILLSISDLIHSVMVMHDSKILGVFVTRSTLWIISQMLFFYLYFIESRNMYLICTLSPFCWFFQVLFFIWEGIDVAVYRLADSRAEFAGFWLGKTIIPFVMAFLSLLVTFFWFLIQRFGRNYRLLKQLSQSSLDSETALQGEPQNTLASATFASGSEVSVDGPSLWSRLKQVFPFMWPKGKPVLQAMMFSSLLCLVAGRVVNVFVPLQFKVVVDSLTKTASYIPSFAWVPIIVYVTLRFLQGGVGLLSAFQNLLWIKVGQHCTREISVRVFEHLHRYEMIDKPLPCSLISSMYVCSLSLQFHLNRKTGEVLRVMDRGTASIVSLLNSILFNIFPTIVDIVVACLFFILQFDGWFGLIVFITMFSYVGLTILLTEWRTKFRKLMNELENKSTTKAVDSLLNFETVKYYGAEAYEVTTYDNHVKDYQKADWKSQSSLNVLNLSQNVIITIGLAAGCLLCAWQVVQDVLSVGDFVLFLTYITQLYGPLNWFGTYYRVIQQNVVDMEKMLDLLMEKVEIRDKPNAPSLIVSKGHVKFDSVTFSYGKNILALRDIGFEILPGQTVALVGSSGGGKSTILRLLFRFYDIQGGSISIDGQDVRDVTAQSLRASIGVVPQDTVLFNDTIKYNIGYGRIGASDEEIMQAAKAAQIHDKIMTFPEGYETRVGERGLRLSGGEKQRVAIARTILKNPKIIVLDEATSALDTHTERHIQSALRKITENRTTLIIAHRLSTIIHADRILVLDNGCIVEHGSHEELLEKQGIYADLWKKQIENTERK